MDCRSRVGAYGLKFSRIGATRRYELSSGRCGDEYGDRDLPALCASFSCTHCLGSSISTLTYRDGDKWQTRRPSAGPSSTYFPCYFSYHRQNLYRSFNCPSVLSYSTRSNIGFGHTNCAVLFVVSDHAVNQGRFRVLFIKG